MRRWLALAALAFASDGTTALHWAVYHNDVKLIDSLLTAGADANARNDYGSTPLSEAAIVGNADVVRKLLKAGADVESPNGDGQTALMIVARTSNIEVAKLLLDHGAKVNARERWRGQTALMWAAAQAQPAMVKLLARHHADVNARSSLTNFERQVTSEPRMQARPAGGFHATAVCGSQGLRRLCAISRRGRCGRQSHRSRRCLAAPARDAESEFRCRGVPREARRRSRQVGYVGPLRTLCGRRHEHIACGRPRRSPFIEHDDGP